jgi:hypothetical protein
MPLQGDNDVQQPILKGAPGAEAAPLRVVKKLPPQARGAIKLAQQFGPALVCVRHRVDATARFRYTTVELLVEKTLIRPREQKLAEIRIGPEESALRAVIKAAGARWDPQRRTWRLPRRLVSILRLSDRLLP